MTVEAHGGRCAPPGERCARHAPTVYVLTWQGDDPFVAGGVPIYATTSEHDAWDTCAEVLADAVSRAWQRPPYLGVSRDNLSAAIGQGYAVFPLKLVDIEKERT